LAIRELLVASHILPWGKHPAERLNVRNGLCFSRLHDAAFDGGFICFDDEYRLVLSRKLKAELPQRSVKENFGAEMPVHGFVRLWIVGCDGLSVKIDGRKTAKADMPGRVRGGAWYRGLKPPALRGVSGRLGASRGVSGRLGASRGVSGRLGASRGVSAQHLAPSHPRQFRNSGLTQNPRHHYRAIP
jgi:hypothetical protein